MPSWMKAGAFLALTSSALLAAPPNGRAHFAPAGSHVSLTAASEVSDDGLVNSNGATLLLDRQSRRANNSVLLKVDTDSCGMVQRMEDRRSILLEGGFHDDSEDDFEDMAPPDQAWAVVGGLLSGHPEVAVMSDAIDKSCEYYNWLDGDGDTSVIA